MTLLEVKQLTKREGNATLFSPLDLHMDQSQCVVIQCRSELGHLFLQVLLGMIPPSGGEVLLNGNRMAISQQREQNVGVHLQKDALYERLKVYDYLHLFNRLYGGEAEGVDKVIRQIGLWDKQHTRCSRLSFSERRRLHVGRCIIHQPQLVIMEDPEYNIDLESRIIIRNVIDELQAEGRSVLLTTSLVEDAISISDHAFRLDESGLKKIELQTEENKSTELEQPSVKDNEQLTEEQDAGPLQQRSLRLEKIPAKIDEKILLFDPLEINYVESMEGTSYLYIKDEKFPCELPLHQLENKLRVFGFFRCHRSYIVNLQRVREVIKWTRNSYSLILDDGKKSTIPLSKGKMEELKNLLGF